MARILMAEVIGTFLLVLIGCGTVIIDVTNDGALGLLGLAICWGATVTTLVYALGPVSGAHINPAMTFGLALDGKFPWKKVAPYFIAQIIGATLAAIALYFFYPGSPTLGQTMPAGSIAQSFAIEVLITFILMFVVLRFAAGPEGRETQAGIGIGFTVLVLVALGGPISGASINPARSIGPALVGGDLTSLWIYVTAPFIGAAIAVALDRVLVPRGSV